MKPWEMNSSERLEYLLTLEDNWDSYGAKAIDMRAFNKAQELLSGYFGAWIVPTSEGGIAFETDEGDDILVIAPDGTVAMPEEED